MLKHLRLFAAFVFAAICSGASALQPTVRAGSISMSGGIKPASTGVTSTTSTTPTTTASGDVNVSRGSALSKFTPTVVPISTGNNNNNVSSSVLAELQEQINDLRSAQLGLEQNQITRDDVETTVESSIKNLDITTTNRDLKNALSEIRSTNQGLSTSLSTIQQRADDFTNSLNNDIDNRLKVRGLIDANNQVSFANKSDIEPNVLAQKIVADTTATQTLANKIQPKENEIREIITDELTDVGVLKNGALDVEKKGQVQVTEATVTNALRNSQNFKNMVSEEVATKGYVTETALNSRDFVTNAALNSKKFVTSDSDTIRNLATKEDIAPATIAAAIADSAAATAALTGKVGTDEAAVNRLILQGLKDKDILTNGGELNVAKTSDITAEKIAEKIANSANAKQTLNGQIGPNATEVDNLISTKLKSKGILSNDANETLQLATKNEVSALDSKFALKGEVGTDEAAVKALIKSDLQKRGVIDDKENLAIATDSEVSSLSGTVRSLQATVDGDVNTSGSLLYRIKNNSEIRAALKGVDGKDGTSYKLKGTVANYASLPKTNNTEGDGWFTKDSGLLYVYNCDSSGQNCGYPSINNGMDIKGEKGESAWYAYCTEIDRNGKTNLEKIITPLYSTVTSCDKFTSAQYNAIMGGARAYCLSLANDGANLDLSTGIGKKLSTVLGSTQMSNFKRASDVQSRIKMTGFKDVDSSKNFVEACEEKYNEIMSGNDGEDAKSAEQVYCEAQAENYPSGTTNLTLIKQLYTSVSSCADFTPEMYNAIMGGAKAYCLSLAQNPTKLVATTGIGLKLEQALGKGVVSNLKTSKVATKVSVNGTEKNFVLACEEKYNEIMSGADGKGYTLKGTVPTYANLPTTNNTEGDGWYVKSNGMLYVYRCDDNGANCGYPTEDKGIPMKGEPGDNGETAWHAYCMETDSNGVSNLTKIITPLYSTVTDCDKFTSSQYNAIMGGAKAYCLSLVQKIDTIDLNEGIGKRLAKTFTTEKIQSLKSADGIQNKLKIKTFGTSKNLNFIDACEEKYNEIMAGEDGEDAESPELAYCKAPAANYTDGTTNLTLARKLFNNSSLECSDFTAAMYAKMIGGADAFCADLTATFNKVDLTKGAGLKIAKVYASQKGVDLSVAKDALTTLKNKTPAARLADTNFSILQACRDNYNSIMSGEDAESPELAYCKAPAANYTDGTTNLILARKLFNNSTLECSEFTAAMYAKMIGGADAFCADLTATFNKVDLTKGAGLKIAKVYASQKGVDLSAAKTALTTLQNKTPAARLADTNFSILQACRDNYNSIMSGEDAETAWHAYCVAQNENDSTKTNLTAIITPLYPTVTKCDQFTSTQYNAIMGGASAYCLSLAQDISASRLSDFNSGIGKRLNTQLKADNGQTVADLKGKNLSVILNNKFNGSKTFVKACEEKYNEIMAGADGAKGENGDDGKSAAETWCEAHLMKNNIVAVPLSPAKMARAYDKLSKISSTYAAKITVNKTAGNGYFTDMASCLAAVAADPDLMGGESEADAKYNELQASEIKNNKFVLANAFTGLSNHRSGFRDTYLKGQKGDDGADGVTFTPTFDSSTGKISWSSSKSGVSAPAAMKVAKTDSELGTLALNAVKTGLGGDSSSNLSTLITNKASNAIGSQAVTMDDLVNYINAGLFKVGSNTVTLNTDFTTSGLSSGETASLQKLSGAGNSSDNTKRIGTVNGTCNTNGVCSVSKTSATGSKTDYNLTPILNP